MIAPEIIGISVSLCGAPPRRPGWIIEQYIRLKSPNFREIQQILYRYIAAGS